jgi:hypothetical protein
VPLLTTLDNLPVATGIAASEVREAYPHVAMTDLEHLDVRPANPAEANAVLDLLNEAAAWLSRRGIQQWPPSFRREWLEPALIESRVLLARLNGVVAKTVPVDWADPFWG